MEEKIIKIKNGTYIITDGNVKIVEGSFSEEDLSKFSETDKSIENIKRKIIDYEKYLNYIDKQKNKDKKGLFIMRIAPICGYILLLFLTSPQTLLAFILPLIPFAILQIAEEWFIKNVLNAKIEQDEETIKTINSNIESLKQMQKLLEEELKQNLAKTQYKETKYNGKTIIKPIDHNQDEINVKISPLTRTLKK